MSEATERTQVLGEEGEACRECGAPLATDQRYCLNCGRRRGAPRVDYRHHVPGRGSTAATNGVAPPSREPSAAASPPAADETAQRDYAPVAAVGGIAILGLMLLVGVLIGRGGGDTASTPPPQIVRLGDEGGVATSGEAGSSGGAAGSKAVAKGGKADRAKNLAGDEGPAGAGPVEASDDALQELQEQSPEEYQESSAKLPDEIATGGAPPPVDSKAPGGGSEGTAIE